MRSCLESKTNIFLRVLLNPARYFTTIKMNEYKHLLINPNEDGYSIAAELLRSGQLVAFPTETVYGLGANALNEAAVRSIFSAKGRPLTDPVIIHIASTDDSYKLVDLQPSEVPIYQSLTKLFWPGPLTIIVKASSIIPSIVTAETGFVSVRFPNHSIARQLISASGVPVAAPSANRFGHVSPTRAVHVLADLGEKGVHVLNGDTEREGDSAPCQFGIESTVAKIDGSKKQIMIFRQGAITQQQLEHVLSSQHPDWSVVAVSRTVKMHAAVTESLTDSSTDNTRIASEEECVGQEAPGQAVTHYAPDVPCFIVQALGGEGEGDAADKGGVARLTVARAELLSECVIIDYNGALQSLSGSALAYRDLSAAGRAAEAAHQLFDTLRWAEMVSGAKKVLIASILSNSVGSGSVASSDECDLSLGVADRVFRAASGQFVTLTIV
jgi:tRNA threonylcarbamoyl adenosine modification protein (Sua5/YciO/YrdC/YwlC family)